MRRFVSVASVASRYHAGLRLQYQHLSIDTVELLNDLGGLAELEEDEDGFRIRGYSCPVAEVVLRRSQAAKLQVGQMERAAQANKYNTRNDVILSAAKNLAPRSSSRACYEL